MEKRSALARSRDVNEIGCASSERGLPGGPLCHTVPPRCAAPASRRRRRRRCASPRTPRRVASPASERRALGAAHGGCRRGNAVPPSSCALREQQCGAGRRWRTTVRALTRAAGPGARAVPPGFGRRRGAAAAAAFGAAGSRAKRPETTLLCVAEPSPIGPFPLPFFPSSSLALPPCSHKSFKTKTILAVAARKNRQLCVARAPRRGPCAQPRPRLPPPPLHSTAQASYTLLCSSAAPLYAGRTGSGSRTSRTRSATTPRGVTGAALSSASEREMAGGVSARGAASGGSGARVTPV
jgi:hypothetical protein